MQLYFTLAIKYVPHNKNIHIYTNEWDGGIIIYFIFFYF